MITLKDALAQLTAIVTSEAAALDDAKGAAVDLAVTVGTVQRNADSSTSFLLMGGARLRAPSTLALFSRGCALLSNLHADDCGWFDSYDVGYSP